MRNLVICIKKAIFAYEKENSGFSFHSFLLAKPEDSEFQFGVFYKMCVFAAMGNLHLVPFFSLEDPIAISLHEDMYDKMRMEVEKWKNRTIWVVFNSNFSKKGCRFFYQ